MQAIILLLVVAILGTIIGAGIGWWLRQSRVKQLADALQVSQDHSKTLERDHERRLREATEKLLQDYDAQLAEKVERYQDHLEQRLESIEQEYQGRLTVAAQGQRQAIIEDVSVASGSQSAMMGPLEEQIKQEYERRLQAAAQKVQHTYEQQLQQQLRDRQAELQHHYEARLAEKIEHYEHRLSTQQAELEQEFDLRLQTLTAGQHDATAIDEAELRSTIVAECQAEYEHKLAEKVEHYQDDLSRRLDDLKAEYETRLQIAEPAKSLEELEAEITARLQAEYEHKLAEKVEHYQDDLSRRLDDLKAEYEARLQLLQPQTWTEAPNPPEASPAVETDSIGGISNFSPPMILEPDAARTTSDEEEEASLSTLEQRESDSFSFDLDDTGVNPAPTDSFGEVESEPIDREIDFGAATSPELNPDEADITPMTAASFENLGEGDSFDWGESNTPELELNHQPRSDSLENLQDFEPESSPSFEADGVAELELASEESDSIPVDPLADMAEESESNLEFGQEDVPELDLGGSDINPTAENDLDSFGESPASEDDFLSSIDDTPNSPDPGLNFDDSDLFSASDEDDSDLFSASAEDLGGFSNDVADDDVEAVLAGLSEDPAPPAVDPMPELTEEPEPASSTEELLLDDVLSMEDTSDSQAGLDLGGDSDSDDFNLDDLLFEESDGNQDFDDPFNIDDINQLS